jgi:hypothetical protein
MRDIEKDLEQAIDDRDWKSANEIADLITKMNKLHEFGTTTKQTGITPPAGPGSLRIHPTETWASPAAIKPATGRGDYL